MIFLDLIYLGISVVLFFRKLSDSTIMQFIENLHKRYPSVNFLKVHHWYDIYIKRQTYQESAS